MEELSLLNGWQESLIIITYNSYQLETKRYIEKSCPPDNMVYIIIEEPILPISHDGISFRQAASMDMMIIKINLGVLFVVDASSIQRF